MDDEVMTKELRRLQQENAALKEKLNGPSKSDRNFAEELAEAEREGDMAAVSRIRAAWLDAMAA